MMPVSANSYIASIINCNLWRVTVIPIYSSGKTHVQHHFDFLLVQALVLLLVLVPHAWFWQSMVNIIHHLDFRLV